ncbi:MAG TPA: exo-alpha-sialidase [Chitinivibrionales bacterium]|nr:exo-alpha-sialidase [Chitinivibrionales bacterium]
MSANKADSASASPSVKKADSTSAFISMQGDCRYPAVTSEGNSIFMAWVATEGVTTSIYYRHSADEGKTWTSSRRLSNDRSDAYPPAMAVNAGTVHVAWVDYGETVDGELYYSRSLDGGETWEKNRILITDANSARYPLLACKDKNVYLIWQDVENKVYFKASRDQGFTWEKELLLGKVGKHSCYCYPPAISCCGNELAVVWTDFSEEKKGLSLGFDGFNLWKSSDNSVSSVVLRTSDDNGRTWCREQVLSATKVSKETKEEIDNPIMLSDGVQSYLFWLDRRNIQLGEIFYARFDPKMEKCPITGRNLYPTEKRSPKRPSVVFDKDMNLHFTWASFFNGESVVSYGEIDQTGKVLREKKDLTAGVGSYYNPIITRTSSGLLHVFWFDQPKDKSEWSRIFLKTSKDNGDTWENWEPQKKDM